MARLWPPTGGYYCNFFCILAGSPLCRPSFVLLLAFHQRFLYPLLIELSMHRAPFSRSVQSLLHLLSWFRGTVTGFPYSPVREYTFCLLQGHFSISFLFSSCTGLHLSASFVQLLIIVSFHAVPYPLSSIGTSCRHSFFSQPRLSTALHSDFTLL